MKTVTTGPIVQLYMQLLEHWNNNDAEGFASLFVPEGLCVGFDGTTYTSREDISRELSAIFADHQVASYVAKVRNIIQLDEQTMLLHGVASMTPPGSGKVKPERNAVQTLLARKEGEEWQIIAYQNTPARYDGRPEAVAALTEELQSLVPQS